jgi:hypothetical protein
MASAIAKTINTYAAVPPVAIALAAAEVAAFIASKAIAFKAINSQTGFKKGGYTGDAPVDKEVGVVHGQEFVNKASDTKKYRPLFEGIHNKDKKLIEIGMRDLLKDTGVVMNSDVPKELTQMKSQARAHEINFLLPKKDLQQEHKIASIEKNTALLVKQGSENNYLNENGDMVIVKGSLTRVIKKK